MKIEIRDVPPRSAWGLEQAGIHPLLARLYAARGIDAPAQLSDDLAQLLPPDQLKGTREAAHLLADAIDLGSRICIVADYDCDGASACAVAIRGLVMLGATDVTYLVPDRITDGYGLTPPIAKRVHAMGAKVLVTVDNGIASMEGVAAAHDLGLKVLVTDHHLPAMQGNFPVLPDADVIVNPNQGGCSFESKAIAGVGVMFYVLLALRTELRQRGRFAAAQQPRLDRLLPLVALGTVADVVRLDANNRRLVSQGLKRIRQGNLPVGMAALYTVSGRNATLATTGDFGFGLGPRINAAGRLSDMTLGIECLTTDDPARAQTLAAELDTINRSRREIEGEMRDQAMDIADALFEDPADAPPAICLFDPDFHEGVVGIVAARLKDKYHRPTFVFAASAAPGMAHELKGSGRSIAGFHLRDALDLVVKRHPGLLTRFGGHAMAAGCTLPEEHLDTFEEAFSKIAAELLDASVLARRITTDGSLDATYRRLDLVDHLDQQVWGQGFAAPVFSDEVDVVSQRVVGEKHLALKLRHGGELVEGIWFGRTEPLPARVTLAYRLIADVFRGERKVKFAIEALAS
jgi:single-stranded-DNA-specific exonuclease